MFDPREKLRHEMNYLAGALLHRGVELPALENMRPVRLSFSDSRGAKSFSRLMDIYRTECMPGNGYDAYWRVTSRDARPVATPSGASLDEQLLKSMVAYIIHRRLGLAFHEYVNQADLTRAMPVYVLNSDWIEFQFDEMRLPARPIPSEGDLAVVVDHPDYDRVRGSVGEISEKRAVFTPLFDSDGASVTLPLLNLMRIRDHRRKSVIT